MYNNMYIKVHFEKLSPSPSGGGGGERREEEEEKERKKLKLKQTGPVHHFSCSYNYFCWKNMGREIPEKPLF